MYRKLLIIYILGVFVLSVAIKAFICSHLGVDPLSTLEIGLSQYLHTSIGFASGIVAAMFLSIWSIWNKKFPPLTPFLTTTSVGYLVDFWNYICLENYVPFNSYIFLIIGVLLCAYSSSLILISKTGIRIMDLIVLSFQDKWEWNFTFGKLLIECSLFITGVLLGGTFGIGTIAFLLFVGSLIEPFMIFNKKVMKID